MVSDLTLLSVICYYDLLSVIYSLLSLLLSGVQPHPLSFHAPRLGLIPLVSNDCKLLKKPFEATGEEGEVTDVVLTLDIKVSVLASVTDWVACREL